MIPVLPGWAVTRLGSAWLLVHPDGEDRLALRYVERERPLRPAPEVVRELPLPDGACLIELGAARPVVTDEGEYASLISTTVEHAGARVYRVVGIIAVDDFHSLLVGHTRRPEVRAELADVVEDLVRRDRHYMALRRRRFLYQPPPGWQGLLVDGFRARWLADDHPRTGEAIDVHPALPIVPPDPLAFVERFLDEPITARADLTTITARGGLAGQLWRARTASGANHTLCALADDRFLYAAVHRAAPGHTGDRLLADLARTIEPIPRAKARAAEPQLLVHDHFAD